jgi:hypothetical protein
MLGAIYYWPQQNQNWCAIANIQAIKEYDYYKATGGQWPTSDFTQTDIYNDVNSQSAVSPWGSTSGYVKANISNDFGLDPRAITYSAYQVTPAGYYFHNFIYQTSAATATHNVALDFGPAAGVNDPISITVYHGQHSFVVSGVYASSDPSQGNETLYGIDTWDPFVNSGFGGSINSTTEEVWSYSDWVNSSSLWGSTYSSNGGQDPDPSTPVNYYVPPFPNYGNQQHHWIGYYVTIEQDGTSVCGTHGPNYALNQYGQPSPHNGSC